MPVNASNNKLGWEAPEFNLLDVKGNLVSLNQSRGDNGTVIAFICNHCPYVIAIIERLSSEAIALKKLSINTSKNNFIINKPKLYSLYFKNFLI